MAKVPYTTSATSGGRKLKWWHGCLIALAVFAAAVAVFVLSILAATKPAVEASEEFFSAFESGQSMQEVYDSTSVIFQNAMSYDNFVSAAESNEFMTNYSYLTINSREIVTDDTGTYAKLSGTIYAMDGYSSPVYIEVEKENEEWKISYIEFNQVDSSYDTSY